MNYLRNHLKSAKANSSPDPKNSTKKQMHTHSSSTALYHEKQVKELCALHSLNNLFQCNLFSKAFLDDICTQLSPEEFINPHRSLLGLGNYNINVIMKALQLKDYEALWFDKRKPITIINLKNVKGFILNVPSEYKIANFISVPWKKKHWIAVTQINGAWFNMDSKLDEPELIGDHNDLFSYLENSVKCKDKELFIIVSKEIDSDGTWRNIN